MVALRALPAGTRLTVHRGLQVFSRLGGAKHSPSDLPLGVPFGQNRGVLHSTWSGPLWTPRSPVQIIVLNQSRICITMIFDALSDGVLNLFMGLRGILRHLQLLVTFWGHFFEKNHQKSHQEESRSTNQIIYIRNTHGHSCESPFAISRNHKE